MNVTPGTSEAMTAAATVMDTQLNSDDSGVFGKHEFLLTKPWAAFPTIVVLSVASFVGTAGNVLTLLAIAFNKKVRNIESIFIVNLAISDLYVTTVADPMSIIAKLEGEHFFDRVPRLCQVIAKLCTISCVTSLLTIATMSLNRYIYVCHNHYYKKIFSKQNSVIICMSVYAVGIFLVLLNQAGIGDHSFDRKSLECIWDRMATYPYTVVYSVTLVWIPCVVIGICYLRLYFFVHMHKKKISNHKKRNGANSPSPGVPPKSKLQLAKTFILIYAVFVTCWAPYALLIIIDHQDSFLHEVHVYLTVWAHLHPSVNWLIYYFTQRKLAEAYRQILVCGLYQNKRNQRSPPSPAETSDEKPLERRPFDNIHISRPHNGQALSKSKASIEWKPTDTYSVEKTNKLSNNNIDIYHKLYEEMRAIHSDGEVKPHTHDKKNKGRSVTNIRPTQSVGDIPEDYTEMEGPVNLNRDSGLVQELCGIVRNIQSMVTSHAFSSDSGFTCEACDHSSRYSSMTNLQFATNDTVQKAKLMEVECENQAGEEAAAVSDLNDDNNEKKLPGPNTNSKNKNSNDSSVNEKSVYCAHDECGMSSCTYKDQSNKGSKESESVIGINNFKTCTDSKVSGSTDVEITCQTNDKEPYTDSCGNLDKGNTSIDTCIK